MSQNNHEDDLNCSSDSILVKSESDADELSSGVCDIEEGEGEGEADFIQEFDLLLKEMRLDGSVDSSDEEQLFDGQIAQEEEGEEEEEEESSSESSPPGRGEGEEPSTLKDMKSPARPHSTPARRPLPPRSLIRKGSDLDMAAFPIFRVPTLEQVQPVKNSLKSPRTKYSSTSTLFVTDSLSKPDLDELLRNLAKALSFHIEKGCTMRNKIYYNIFSEEIYPLTEDPDLHTKPDEIAVHTFLKGIFDFQKLDVECAIMSLIYVERLLEITKMTIDASNWRRVLLGALIIASKVWEDLAVWNQDFLSVFNNTIPVTDFNQLELQFLHLSQYKLTITSSTYAKYFFQLKVFSHKGGNVPAKPLNKENLRVLCTEVESRTQRDRLNHLTLTRSVSLDNIRPIHVPAPAVIN